MNRSKLPTSFTKLVVSVALGLLLILGVADTALAAPVAPAPRPMTLTGHLVPTLKGHQALRATDGQQALSLAIVLRPRNAAQMQTLPQQTQQANGTMQRKPLTPEQFAAAFGRTPAEINTVKSYLTSRGLHITRVASNNLSIGVTGAVSLVERAFNVRIDDFSLHGRTVYAPINDPSVPASLGTMTQAIIGLDNVVAYEPHNIPSGSVAQETQQPNARTGTGPDNFYAPSDLRTAYDMNSLVNTYNGTGQTISVVELAGYNESDVQAYRDHFGLGTLSYQNTSIDGASTSPANPDKGTLEVLLDMEVISAIAPGATQHIYIGPNTDTGIYDTYNQIALDNTGSVASTSWGECELDQPAALTQAMAGIFLEYAWGHDQFFAAAGDGGAYDCTRQGDSTNLAVDYPASDPNVMGVGGTSLVTNGSQQRTSETAWSNTNVLPNVGGGGGNSAIFPMSIVQQGPNVVNNDSTGYRPVPDVAANADPATGYAIYCTDTYIGCSSSGSWGGVGGTSAAAPLWAAVVADCTQYIAVQTAYPYYRVYDSLLYLFFRLAKNGQLPYAPYVDITSGNNLHFSARSGFDLATGMGVPDAWNLARDLFAFYNGQIQTGDISGPGEAQTWYFAEGYTGSGFTEYLTLANPNPAMTRVNVTYFLQNGSAPILKIYTVNAYSRKTINVNTELGIGVGVSMEVDSENYKIIAERSMYFTFTGAGLHIPGGTDVLGATSLQTQFEFGYLDTTAKHATYLTVLNPHSITMTATVDYFTAAGGSPIVVTHSVPPNARGTILVNNDVPAGTYSAIVELSSSDPGHDWGFVERPMYFVDATTGKTGATDVFGTWVSLNSWYFAEGYTNSNFSERYILSNPEGFMFTATAQATVTFLKSDGTTVSVNVTINPGAQVVINANSVLGNGVNNSAVVTSSGFGILAERVMSFQYTGPVGVSSPSSSIPGATDVFGSSELSYWWGFAEGYTGGSFAEYLTLANPNASATRVTITYLPADGSTPAIQLVTVGAHTRYTIYTNNEMSGQSFSVLVNAGAPIVVERPMYFVYGANQTGGTDVIGSYCSYIC
jgi:pro-kumamolisin-like protein